MTSSLIYRMTPARAGSLPTQAVLVLGGSLLLAIAAKVQVPFWPVPMTLQTLAVLVIGAVFGARLAGATVLAYLAEGALGLPVFASGAGLAYLAGPTGGYLVGFLLAAMFLGWCSDRCLLRRLPVALGLFFVAQVLIFAPGVGWLAAFIGLPEAVMAGAVPFLAGEALKLVLAALLVTGLWRRARAA